MGKLFNHLKTIHTHKKYLKEHYEKGDLIKLGRETYVYDY